MTEPQTSAGDAASESGDRSAAGRPSAAHDSAIVEQWYHDHYADLHRFVRGLLRNADAAADVSQIVFRKALENCQTVDRVHVRGWLFRVGYQEAMLARRKAGVERRGAAGYWERRSGGDSPEVNPPQRLEMKEDRERFRVALSQLPEAQREVIVRRLAGQETFAEIAAALGVPLGTVLTRMRRGMEAIQQAVGRSDG